LQKLQELNRKNNLVISSKEEEIEAAKQKHLRMQEI